MFDVWWAVVSVTRTKPSPGQGFRSACADARLAPPRFGRSPVDCPSLAQALPAMLLRIPEIGSFAQLSDSTVALDPISPTTRSGDALLRNTSKQTLCDVVYPDFERPH